MKTSIKPKTALPAWDLSDLFSGITDPRIDALLETQHKAARTFEKTYRKKLTEKVSPAVLLKAIQAYERIQEQISKPAIYAELIFSVDCKKPEHGAFLQRTRKRVTDIMQTLVFFDVEFSKLSESTLKRLAKEKMLQPYRHYIARQLQYKPHTLSEVEEKIFNDTHLTGRSSFVRLFEEELSTKEFFIQGESKPKTESEMIDVLYTPDRKRRKAAAEGFTKGLRDELRRLTFITNTLLQDKQTNDRYRHFESPEAARHLSNEITQDMVDAMSGVVRKSYHLVHDFYRFKSRALKLGKLYDYDRYAPLTSSKHDYSFAEAKDIVLTAYRSFSPKMEQLARDFFEKKWIDAAPKAGKRGGAYCMFVTPDSHPYVFMNYNGKLNDIKTLAHELGHAVHACLSRKQSYLNFDTPLTVAETASVFGEMLVFDHLRSTLKDPKEKFALYMEKIESIFATVHRQISMYTFEQDLHAAAKERGELPPEEINKLWRKRQVEMFGNSVTMTPNYDLWWSYVSHFIHTPFYVYAYAFGELLTLSLFAAYKQKGPSMAEAYLTMLETGGSVSPMELVKPFGIDLANPKFWQGGIDMIAELIEEAKALQHETRRT